MALWVELPLGLSRQVVRASRLAQGVAVLGAVLAASGVSGGGFPPVGSVVVSLLLLALAAGQPVRHWLRNRGWLAPVHLAPGSTLCIDAAGAAFLRPAVGLAIPLQICHAHRGLGVIWVEAIGEGHRYRLLSGLDRAGDLQWSRIGAWLSWLQRGDA